MAEDVELLKFFSWFHYNLKKGLTLSEACSAIDVGKLEACVEKLLAVGDAPAAAAAGDPALEEEELLAHKRVWDSRGRQTPVEILAALSLMQKGEEQQNTC